MCCQMVNIGAHSVIVDISNQEGIFKSMNPYAYNKNYQELLIQLMLLTFARGVGLRCVLGKIDPYLVAN